MTVGNRLFPMLDGPAIPWWLAEIVYEGYVALYGDSQSLERLAERGGFGWGEVAMIGDELKRKRGYDVFNAWKRRVPEGV